MGILSKARGLLLLVACTLMCASVGGAGDESAIRWTMGMGSNLSEAEVFWDFTEVGAPLILLPNRGGKVDPQKIIELSFLFAELPPGDYEYQKPESDQFEHHPELEERPEVQVFHFEEKHRKIIRSMSVRNSYTFEDGKVLVGVDAKRPYGDLTYFEADMAQVLGLPVGRNERNEFQLAPEVEEQMGQLHLEMEIAVQVFLRNASVKPGTFKELNYGAWERL